MPDFLYTEQNYSLTEGIAHCDSRTLELSCYEMALRSYNDNNLLDAIFNLEQVGCNSPNYKDASERLRYYQQELEGIQANEVVLREQLRQNPDDPEGRFDLADTLYVLGKTPEAISTWQELARRDSGYWGKRAQKILTRLHKSNNEVDAMEVDTMQEASDEELTRSLTATPK